MKTSERIIDYIERNGQASGRELADYLGITDRAVRKQLKSMEEGHRVMKAGRPPRVYYSIAIADDQTASSQSELDRVIDKATKRIIEANFLYITPRGTIQVGWEGFVIWCQERHLDVTKTAARYQDTMAKYGRYKKDGLIDGMNKLEASFSEVALDRVYYIDFYSIEIFGRTKLGQLLLIAKQSQDRRLINEIADLVKPKILTLLKQYKIDGVGYIPPTVRRELQLMRRLEKRLNLDTRILAIHKIKTQVAVPQKTLSKIEDRMVNAETTISVGDTRHYHNILLIDDAIGSGSTLNETAKKIRQRGLCDGEIIGLAITGSFKGFEVISEV